MFLAKSINCLEQILQDKIYTQKGVEHVTLGLTGKIILLWKEITHDLEQRNLHTEQ